MKKLLSCLLLVLLTACANTTPPETTNTLTPPPAKPKIKIGLALGGGAAKGFAHIGVIKMLEANGIKADIVTGTSAGSVVGSLYASGMDPFTLQQHAFSLDQSDVRDVHLFNGGLIKGEKLQNYINELVKNRTMERFPKLFAAVATELDTGRRVVFGRGNTGQAVRASSSIPGVFEPVVIGSHKYVDGGVVSPVPVLAARELGADFVIAVDISRKAGDSAKQDSMTKIVGQSVAIMGQKLGEQELTKADIVIRPRVGQIGSADFDQKNVAILEGEKATLALMSEIKRKIDEKQKAR